MKTRFIYLALPILLSLQACNNNSGTETTIDSTATLNTSTDSTMNENTDTAAGGDTTSKSINRIDASAVPNSVITAFNSKYSGTADVKWAEGSNKRGKTFYRAHWQSNGKKMMAIFNDDGKFVKEKELN
ncbi:MAG: hypothetical protein JO072_13005 [Parafilimonas sp.]|nr:hypothetical protein [Parafilimonas sp.]